jgi:hypothetical protein
VFLSVLGDVTSANWGMKALASTTSLNQLMTSYLESLTIGDSAIRQAVGRPYSNPYIKSQLLSAVEGTSSWNHETGPWVVAISVLVLIVVFLLAVAWYALWRSDTGRRRHSGNAGLEG